MSLELRWNNSLMRKVSASLVKSLPILSFSWIKIYAKFKQKLKMEKTLIRSSGFILSFFRQNYHFFKTTIIFFHFHLNMLENRRKQNLEMKLDFRGHFQ